MVKIEDACKIGIEQALVKIETKHPTPVDKLYAPDADYDKQQKENKKDEAFKIMVEKRLTTLENATLNKKHEKSPDKHENSKKQNDTNQPSESLIQKEIIIEKLKSLEEKFQNINIPQPVDYETVDKKINAIEKEIQSIKTSKPTEKDFNILSDKIKDIKSENNYSEIKNAKTLISNIKKDLNKLFINNADNVKTIKCINGNFEKLKSREHLNTITLSCFKDKIGVYCSCLIIPDNYILHSIYIIRPDLKTVNYDIEFGSENATTKTKIVSGVSGPVLATPESLNYYTKNSLFKILIHTDGLKDDPTISQLMVGITFTVPDLTLDECVAEEVAGSAITITSSK